MQGESHGFMNVVGESFYQETLRGLHLLFSVSGDPTERVFTVVLVPEPENSHDENAVAVKTEGGFTIGYLPRDVARINQKTIAARGTVRCLATLCGGRPDAPSIGVVLDFRPVKDPNLFVLAEAEPVVRDRREAQVKSQAVLRPRRRATDGPPLLIVVGWANAIVSTLALIYGLVVTWVL